MFQPVSTLKALSDETRLKIIGILDGNSLSVNEIMYALNMGQSRISRHLKILSDAGILEFRRDGARVYYSIAAGKNGTGEKLSGLLEIFGIKNLPSENLCLNPEKESYLDKKEIERLSSIIKERSLVTLKHYENTGDDEEERQAAWVDPEFYGKKICSFIPSDATTATDLGCGSGRLAGLLRDVVSDLICVDQSENMLDRARKSLGGKNIDFRIGSLRHLPLRDGEVNLAVLSMVLHHVPDFINALKEANRVTSHSGKLIISELKKHRHEEMRDSFADFYLGFDEDELCDAVKSCGYRIIKKERGKGKGKLECIFIQAEKIQSAGN